MKKALVITSITIGVLSFASVFLWAGFDYSWWTPIADDDRARGPAIWFVHFVGMVQFLAMLGCSEERRGKF